MASDDIRSAARALLQDFNTLIARAEHLKVQRDAKADKLKERYRPELDLMTSDRDLAFRYLRDQVASLRLLALQVLSEHWTPDSFYYDECERLAGGDPELLIRARSLKKLGAYYAGTGNPRLLTLAARFAWESRANESYAYGAYRVFCRTAGVEMKPPTDWREIKLFYVNWQAMEPFY
jgi:hypothetical protein